MTEIFIPEHWLPRNATLASTVISGNASLVGQARVGKRGASFFCPNVAIFSSDIESVLVRPAIRLPTCLEVVDIIGHHLGYTCTLSDKGFYTRELVDKLGGLPDAARFFRDNEKRGAILKFLDESPPERNLYNQGVFLRDRRRYLNFEALHATMGTSERAREFIDFGVRCQFLFRGFIFKCQFCRHSAWYAVGETTERFTCARCGRSQVYTYHNWRYPDEPSWFYKLDEIVYQGLAHECYLTLLALDALRQRGPQGFLYTFEVDLRQEADDSSYCEIDVCAVTNGDLVIGEVKKGERLERQPLPEEQCILRYRQLAEGLGVRLVVFATAEMAWSERTSDAIDRVFRDSVVPVQRLTRSDLFY